MSTLGFTTFTTKPVVAEPTLRERVVALTDGQRATLLNSYELMIPAAHLSHQLGLSIELIEYVYQGMSDIQDASRLLMRDEYLITPEVTHIDANGQIVIDTPAVYADVPTTQVLLRQAIAPLFQDDYPILFTSNVVNAMIKCSKWGGTGSFAFYQSQIIL